jgi:hypothetical protein
MRFGGDSVFLFVLHTDTTTKGIASGPDEFHPNDYWHT